MGKSIYNQLWFAIDSNFREGTDKHSYLKEHGTEMSDKVFSYGEKKDLLDKSKTISNFMKENYSEITKIKDIKSEHIQDFLNSRKENGCTQTTITQYYNIIKKIEVLTEKTYHISPNFTKDIVLPTSEKNRADNRGANSVMKREEYDKIINYCKDNPTQSNYAIRVQGFLGVRVEELARIKINNIDMDKMEIKIEGKGGKACYRAIPMDKIELMKEIIDKKYDKNGNRLFSIEGATINRQLSRIQERLKLEKHSNHDIRRLIAQEKYDKLRNDGATRTEAIRETSKWLSHGDNREQMLIKSYIKAW